MALTPARVDLSGRAVVLESFKKRRQSVYRAMPVLPSLLDQLDLVHGVREAQKQGRRQADHPLWPWARNIAWRRVKVVMAVPGILGGAHCTLKCLRHGYGVHAIGSGMPLNTLPKWRGHATLDVTVISAIALGAEEQGYRRQDVGAVASFLSRGAARDHAVGRR